MGKVIDFLQWHLARHSTVYVLYGLYVFGLVEDIADRSKAFIILYLFVGYMITLIFLYYQISDDAKNRRFAVKVESVKFKDESGVGNTTRQSIEVRYYGSDSIFQYDILSRSGPLSLDECTIALESMGRILAGRYGIGYSGETARGFYGKIISTGFKIGKNDSISLYQ